MKYSKYFSEVTKENGVPNVSQNQFQRMMNIVCVEGKIEGMRILKETYKDTPEYNRFDLLIFKYEKQLADLTGHLSTHDLLKEMHHFD
jgi:hypothetical protein